MENGALSQNFSGKVKGIPMSGKRFNIADASTKVGAGLAAVSVIAPQVASQLSAINPDLATKISIGGLILSALLGAKKGR